ncbi:ATP-binding cassette domain-containing protein [Desulfobotulus sp. H1]|uniref:ATP-binding cassette domain-containing protein n=1 Tax=Desulfobotulus pelophilus TaxID=2823377 RepID=A0ABT3NC26_9BACT|nr:ATP-binding cassette domain-containing protein [Desulfobotulus pelophilus]MCW7754726.1 ATP-binding cassette domain-containing protein [Desulfobotulus pelophilus]
MFRAQNIKIHHIGPVSLSVEAGECAGISGPSGAGKSILFRAFADIEVFSGTLMLDNVIHTDMSGPQWRRQVALMPAESQWWLHTAGEHFPGTFPEKETAFMGFPPDVPSWEIHRLSSGEKQRLALLRILANEPKVLLLDEPTANLDAEGTKLMEKLIFDYQKRTRASLIWISHNPEQLQRVCHTLYYLANGILSHSGRVLY